MTIALVDDDPDVRFLVRTWLDRSGRFSVIGEGGTGLEAIALAKEQKPAVVLLDVSMPEMDGIEALPRIITESPATRVVMFTGFDRAGLAERARHLGAHDIIEKSMPVSQLPSRLLEVLGADARSREPDPPTGTAVAEGSQPPGSSATDSGEAVLARHVVQFGEVFEQAAVALATMTLTGTLVHPNRSFARLVGRSADDLVGASYSDLASPNRHADLTRALEEARKSDAGAIGLEHELATGPAIVHVRGSVLAIRDADTHPLYLLLQLHDAVREHPAEDALRRNEATPSGVSDDSVP